MIGTIDLLLASCLATFAVSDGAWPADRAVAAMAGPAEVEAATMAGETVDPRPDGATAAPAGEAVSPGPSEVAAMPAAETVVPRPDGATASPAGETVSAGRGEARAVDYLWVLRSAILDRASVDSLIARAQGMGVRGLLIQVVGRGDAYYRSDLLPRSEALEGRAPPDFDPLGEAVTRARAVGLEVHAWMNCMLVWSAPKPPRDPRHVLNAHPEWVAGLKDGRRMSELHERERRHLMVEGVYLSAAHPRVRTWLASIAAEIARRYDVNGIHLDYIRQPDVAVGYDPNSRARFAMRAGVDPERFDRVDPLARAAIDSAWAAFQRDQLTAVVREVRDSLRAVRAGLELSAAVIADSAHAERVNAQAWREWVRDSLVDRVFPMCYAPSVQKVMDQLMAWTQQFGPTERVVPGIAMYNTSASAAALKIMGARTLGYTRIALYSYDSLIAKRGAWPDLRDRLTP